MKIREAIPTKENSTNFNVVADSTTKVGTTLNVRGLFRKQTDEERKYPMKIREAIPTKENSTNFNVVADSTTKVGTTLENLKAAVCGETGASAKYAACAVAAKEQGYDQIARLFQATSAAEQVHIGLEAALIKGMEPDYVKPEPPAAEGAATDLNLIAGAMGEIYETSQVHIGLEAALIKGMEPDYVKPEPPAAEGAATDLNLIAGAMGEIYETSDMYPAFIVKAVEEGEDKAVQVFTRAKLAEAVHAEL